MSHSVSWILHIFADANQDHGTKMKNKDQILRYIRNHDFSDEDWGRILAYCQECAIKKVHHGTKTGIVSSYEDFTEWIDNGLGVGDVAIYEGSPCMVGDCFPGKTYIIGIFRNGKLDTDGMLVDTGSLIAADESESERFVSKCKMSGYQVNYSLGLLTKGRMPKKWDKVVFSHEGGRYIGILSDFDSTTGNCTFAFTISEGHIVKDVSFSILDIEIKPAESNDIKSMQDTLELNGLKWNQRGKCLELDCPRAELGQTYWYISDVFTIRNGIEKGSAADKMRRQNGNYFLRNGDALSYLDRITQIRASMLSEKTEGA